MQPHGYIIIIKHDGRDGSVYPVITSTCTVGRAVRSDVRFRVESVAEEHCAICTSEFQPAVLKNLSRINRTAVNNVPLSENQQILQHGDIITTGERSFRWEYHSQSRYYIPTKAKDTRSIPASPLPGSSGMVGMPISVLQSTLGNQPFGSQSVVITERKVKSPALVAANRQTVSPSKLVAVVSPQRRPQSENKTESEQKQPLAETAEERKRKLESGLRSAERAAKRLKLESPKTPDKKKMAALLVCHGKVSRTKTPQIVSSASHEVVNTSPVKSARTMTPASKSLATSTRKTARKKYETLQTSVGGDVPSPTSVNPKEVSTSFVTSSGTVHLNVASVEKHKIEDSPTRLSLNRRRRSSHKTARTVSPGLPVAADSRGDNGRSVANVTIRRRSTKSTLHASANVVTSGRHSHSVSADHTQDVKVTAGSDKRSPRRNLRESLFRQLMNTSVQSTSAFVSEDINDAKTPEHLRTSNAGKTRRSATAKFSVTSVETSGMCSSRKSDRLSARQCPESGSNSPRTRKFASSPEEEVKGRLINSNTPVSTADASRRNLRFTTFGVQSPKSIESRSGTPQTQGEGVSIVPSTYTSQLTPSTTKSRTPNVTQSAKSDKLDSGSLYKMPYTGQPVSSSTPAHKQTASATNLRDIGVMGTSPKSVDQSSKSVGKRRLSGSPSQKEYDSGSISKSFVLKRESARSKSKYFRNLSSDLDGVGLSSSASRYSESLHVPKSSGKRVHRLSKSETGLNSVSPQTAVSAQETDILRKRSSTKERLSHSSADNTYLLSPGSQNVTFDFDSVKTPCITIENFVSPLSSNRKRSLSWQDISTSKRKQKLEPVLKMQSNSERISRNVTSSGSSTSQHLLTVLDGSVDTCHTEDKKWGSHNNTLSDRGKTRSSYSSASPKSHDIHNIMKRASRISKTPENGLANVRGVQQLMNTPMSQKSSAGDRFVVHGGMKIITTPRSPKSRKKTVGMKGSMKTPRNSQSLRNVSGVQQIMTATQSPKSPKNDLTDVHGVKRLVRSPKIPKSPKNDLTDVRGVRRLMTSPKVKKSPKNDLTDVRGVKQLLRSPKVQKSPQNDLTDVRGVKQLMTSPKVQKSPKNDLTDVRGVKQLMRSPNVQKSPKNDLTDVRGVKQLMRSPKVQKSPKNDLTDVHGVRRLMTSPKIPKSPKNELTDVRGVKQLMRSPKVQKSPKNDLTNVSFVKFHMTTPQATRSSNSDVIDVVGVKDLEKTKISRSTSKGLTDTVDAQSYEKMSVPLQHPEVGGHATQTESTPKSPGRIVQGVASSSVTGTHHTKHGNSFTYEGLEADISMEMNGNQMNIPIPKDKKRINTRSTRNRKEPDIGTSSVEVADTGLKPSLKKLRQKKVKTECHDDFSSSSNLDISPVPTLTSVASKHVHWNVSESPSTPGSRVTRRRLCAPNADMELILLPPRTGKTMKSKERMMTENPPAQEDINDVTVPVPSGRKTRGRQFSAEVSSSATRSQQGTGVSTDVNTSPLPKQNQGITAKAKGSSPLSSTCQQRDTAQISVEESSPPRKRRGGTISTIAEELPPPRKLHATVTEDTTATVPSAELTSRRRRGGKVTEVEIPPSPVTRKTRGKLAAAPTAINLSSEDLFSASDKQPATKVSPSPGKKRKRSKPVEPLPQVLERKLTDGEEGTVSSRIRTRNRKPKITSSPVLTAKSPPAVSRRGSQKTKNKEVSPQVPTGRQTRASSRRKK